MAYCGMPDCRSAPEPGNYCNKSEAICLNKAGCGKGGSAWCDAPTPLPGPGDACTYNPGCQEHYHCQGDAAHDYKCDVSTDGCTCVADPPKPLCGGESYDPGSQLCCNNVIIKKEDNWECCEKVTPHEMHDTTKTSCYTCNGQKLPPVDYHCCTNNTAQGLQDGLYPDKDYPTGVNSVTQRIMIGPKGTHVGDTKCEENMFYDASTGHCVPPIATECCNLIGTGCSLK